jgi:hypothetical protein
MSQGADERDAREHKFPGIFAFCYPHPGGAVAFGICGSSHAWTGELPRALSYAQGPRYRVVELPTALLEMSRFWKYNVFGELSTLAD